jgi:PKD repeat protein
MILSLRQVLVVPAFMLFALSSAKAQCPDCVADVTCTATPAYPTLCPAVPPEATAGEPYQTDITFWLPTAFTDPGTGFDVTFNQMTITSVTGLPFGLALETNDPAGIYFPQQNQYGCARICGTPVGPGTFDVTISIIAGVTFSGIDINAPQQFVIPLVVLPGSGANNSFSFTPSTGCGTVEVDFDALIDASPAPMAWAWDFGNGQSSTSPQPPVQIYDAPGTYTISLETVIQGYVLNAVNVTGVNGNWCGDVEETFCNCGTPIIGTCPDLYFVLNSANGPVFTSNTIDGVTSTGWSNLNILLQDPPYSITVWDEDVVSQNDNLGTYDITLSPGGSFAFNVAGGTAGSLVIDLVALQTFNDSDVVTVFPVPEVVVEEQANGQLCVGDADLVGYVWFLDGDTVPNAFGPCVTPTGPGLWWAVATNGFGCATQSNVVVVCPQLSITRTGTVLSVPAGYISYTWSLDGTPIPGAGDPFLIVSSDGVYSITVEAANDCILTASFDYSTVGIEQLESAGGGIMVYPIPNEGLFTVEAAGLIGTTAMLRILDLSGRSVYERQEALTAGRMKSAVVLNAAPGSYVVQVDDGTRSFVQRIVLR